MNRVNGKSVVSLLFTLAQVTFGIERVSAQPTGTLAPRSGFTRAQEERRQETVALLVDGSATSSARSSAWSMAFVALEENQEVKIQANLCDVITICGEHTPWDVTLVRPVGKDKGFLEFADLNGMGGKTRLETGFSRGMPSPTDPSRRNQA